MLALSAEMLESNCQIDRAYGVLSGRTTHWADAALTVGMLGACA